MFDHSRRPVPDRSGTVLKVPQSDLPLDRWRPGAALAVIAGTQGPAYRLAGAGMVIATLATFESAVPSLAR